MLPGHEIVEAYLGGWNVPKSDGPKMSVSHEIVLQAQDTKELIIQAPATVDSISLGCWAMIEGTFEIAEKHAYDKGGFTPKQIKRVLRNNCLIFFRGCGWQKIPLENDGQLSLSSENNQKLQDFKKYCRDQIDELNKSNQLVH